MSHLAGSEMVPPEVRKRWYEALLEEDSLRVKRLLKDYRQLLKVGWNSDTNLEVEGSPDNHWMPRIKSPWKGRTALHVGARRGAVELVQQVLILCDITDVALLVGRTAEFANRKFFPKAPIANKSPLEDQCHQSIHTGFTCDGCNMSPISGPRFHSCRKFDCDLCLKCFYASDADENDYTMLYALAGRMRGHLAQPPNRTSYSVRKISSTVAASRVDVDTRNAPLAENSSANSTPWVLYKRSEGDEERPRDSDSEEGLVTQLGRSAQDKIGMAKRKRKDAPNAFHDGITSEGDKALQKYKSSIANLSYSQSHRIIGEAVTCLSDNLVSSSELRELLLSKDGDYELDAFAMAALQGNVDVVALLVYALGECDSFTYGVEKSRSFSPADLIDKDCTQYVHKCSYSSGIRSVSVTMLYLSGYFGCNSIIGGTFTASLRLYTR